MSWTIHPVSGGLADHRVGWDLINRGLYQGHPLFDSRFVDALLRHFGAGNELLCKFKAGASEDGGMLILRPEGAGRWSSFLPAQAQVAPLLLKHPRNLMTLFAHLPGRPWLINALCQDPRFSTIAGSQTDLPTTVQTHSLTMSITIKGDFDLYWQSRPRKLIQNLRRYRKRLAEDAKTCRLEKRTETIAVRDATARYGVLESAGWKGRIGTAVSPDNVQGLFYSEVLGAFAESGNATVYEFFIEDCLAASRLVIDNGNTLVALKTAYDERFAQYSPGRLLLYEFLQFEFSRGRAREIEIEFYTNASADQLAWSTSSRHIQHVSLFRNRSLQKGYELADMIRKRIQLSKTA